MLAYWFSNDYFLDCKGELQFALDKAITYTKLRMGYDMVLFKNRLKFTHFYLNGFDLGIMFQRHDAIFTSNA